MVRNMLTQPWHILINSIFIKRHAHRFLALFIWIALLSLYRWYTSTNELTPLAVTHELLRLMQTSLVGPLIFIVFYTLQPLIFFPSWLLTVGAGYVYGPIWGTLYTLLASNFSSVVAYWTGRYFGHSIVSKLKPESLSVRYAHQMRNKSFETVLVMRLLFLPYDLVSYLAGFLRIDIRPFIIATIIGSLPGTLAFVLFGSSIENDFQGQQLTFNPWILGGATTIFLLSLLLWHRVKKRLNSSRTSEPVRQSDPSKETIL